VLEAQGKLDDALKFYRSAALGIFERLAAADRSNADWQRDIAVSYDKIGKVLVGRASPMQPSRANRHGWPSASGCRRSIPPTWCGDAIFQAYEHIGDV